MRGDPDLTAREIDIALRFERFERSELVMRRVGTLGFGLYASRSWLEAHGEPDFAAGCRGHRLIGLSGRGELPEHARWLAEHAGHARMALRTDCREAQLAAARQASV